MNAKFRFAPVAAIIGLAMLLTGTAAKATNLITNGSFEQLTGGIGQIGYNGSSLLTGWTNNTANGNLGYNFVYSSGSADTTGANGVSGNVKLWGPGDGSNNGLPATSPDGGNYIAADGAYEVAPISQTINGLVSGQQYALSFWYAGAQQYNFNGITTEQWLVSLGGQQLSTAVLTDQSNGFTGWQYTTLTFTATSSSELLSFLAAGTPNGEPPFTLLDGVSLNAVPEPGSGSLLLSGVIAVGLFVRRRQLKRTA